MDVMLQSVQDLDPTDSEQAIFNLLKATLEYPANAQAKCRKLADDIIFYTSRQDNSNLGEILWEVWSVVIDIACTVPPSHPWQESLVQALSSLRQRDNDIFEREKSGLSWKDLPNLPQTFSNTALDPTYTGEELNGEFARWKNLNSFVARLTSHDFAPWLNLPIWQLRMALEEPPVEGPAMECRLWVASEWIIHCADSIFQDLNTKEELDEGTAQSLRTGSLCQGISPLSLERWEFWKKRLVEIAANAVGLGLDDAIATRMSDAIKHMDAVK